MHGHLRQAALLLTAIAMAIAPVVPAPAQAPYPNRPMRIVVPYTAGTGIDILARVIGQKLSDNLKVAVVVDNRPGASGNIGTEAVAKAPPDGYTLLMTASTHVTNAALQASVPYDPVKSFTPIGPAAIGSLALVVHPSVPARSVQELVALAKAQPGKLNYASPGSGTPHHLAMELFKLHFKVDLTHVPYKGTAGAVTDLLGGQVQVMFLPVHVALAHVQAGKLRMLAAGGARRSPVTPEVPSLADEGVTDIDVDIWYAMLGPAGLPKSEAVLLNAEIERDPRRAGGARNAAEAGLEPDAGKAGRPRPDDRRGPRALDEDRPRRRIKAD